MRSSASSSARGSEGRLRAARLGRRALGSRQYPASRDLLGSAEARSRRSSCCLGAVLVFEQVHGRSPDRRLVAHDLAGDCGGSPSACPLGVARPEVLREKRPGVGEQPLSSTALAPLSARTRARRVIDNLLAGADHRPGCARANRRGIRGKPALRRAAAFHDDRRRAPPGRGRRPATAGDLDAGWVPPTNQALPPPRASTTLGGASSVR